MKRIIALMVLLLSTFGCSAGKEGLLNKVDRETVLPVGLVSTLAGASMRLACDRREIDLGCICWAWEGTGGEPRLIYLEMWLPPADSAERYRAAADGSETLEAPAGAEACYDGRSAHLLCGSFYIRMTSLGLPDERSAYAQIIERVAVGLAQ